MRKLSLIFGAGAESDLGMPLGGEFSFELLRFEIGEGVVDIGISTEEVVEKLLENQKEEVKDFFKELFGYEPKKTKNLEISIS